MPFPLSLFFKQLVIELASFISVFKHLSKTIQDQLEEGDKENICDDELTAKEVDKSVLEKSNCIQRDMHAVLGLLLQNAVQIFVKCIRIVQPFLRL